MARRNSLVATDSALFNVLARTSVRRWRPFFCPGLLVLLGLGFALLPLARGEFFFYWDNAQQHYPSTEFLRRALRSGEIPHWWPQVGLGLPAIAEGQAAYCHPIRLLLALIFAPPVAFMVEIGLYLAVAGLSTYLFLRAFNLKRAACLVGGLCQMFGSYSVIFIKNMVQHRSFSLLPLAMLLAERFATRRRVSYGLAASLVFGLQLLSGYPTFAIVAVVATTSYILFRVLQRSWCLDQSFRSAARQAGRALICWGIFVALGFGVAAVQVIPQQLHVKHSVRQGGLNFEYAANSLSAKLRYLPQLLFPYVYSQGDWLEKPTSWGSYFNEAPYGGIYIGAFPVLLALFALWWRRRWPDPAWPLAICFLMAIGLALGAKTPLFPALWSLPGMNGLRYPSRFLMLASFCLACLAALGLHRLLARSRLGLLRTRDFLPFLLLASVVLLLALLFWARAGRFAGTISLAQDFPVGIVISLGLFAIAFSLGINLLLVGRRYHGLLLALAVLFVLADLWMFRTRSDYAPTFPIREARAAPPLAEVLNADRDRFRIMSLISWGEYTPRNEDLREFMQSCTCTIWGIDSADDYSSLMLKRHFVVREAAIWELLNSPESAEKLAGFLGALNVKYVVAPRSVSLPGWEIVHQTSRAATWRNPAFLPRAFLVGEATPENIKVNNGWSEGSARRLERYRRTVSSWGTRLEEAHLLDHIMSRRIDYRTTAVVNGRELPALSGLDPESEVRAVTEQANRMTFAIKTRKPALLVISNNYYPGWAATVNGQPAHLYRANWVGMGVLVPAGRSEVVLRFVTPGFRAGLLVTVASLALTIAGLVIAARLKPTW